MLTGLIAFAIYGAIAAFAACGLSLALLGLGLPYIACAALAAVCAGLMLYAAGRWQTVRVTATVPPVAPPPVSEPALDVATARIEVLEHELSALRHELRGALSPALMVSDRLLRSEDPLIRRAGDAVVRSVQRATTLIGQDRPVERPTPRAG